MLAALGSYVTLVERREHPLEFLDREIVGELIHQLRHRNVAFHFEEAVERLEILEGPPARVALLLESGKRIIADMVLFSVGRVGATDGLRLEAAGLAADERGRLKVDERFRTSVPHIFAAGDVIGYPSLASTSMEQGRLAACHAFGIEVAPMAGHFPIGIYSIPEMSMVGAPEHTLTRMKIPYETGVARYREIARGQILGDDTGFFKMLFHRETRQLLGVHAIGTGATELIHIGQAVLGLGGGLDYFLHTVFNYPTFAECYTVAALNASNKLSLEKPLLPPPRGGIRLRAPGGRLGHDSLGATRVIMRGSRRPTDALIGGFLQGRSVRGLRRQGLPRRRIEGYHVCVLGSNVFASGKAPFSMPSS